MRRVKGFEFGRRTIFLYYNSLLINGNFESAVNISNEFEWLSIFTDTHLFYKETEIKI